HMSVTGAFQSLCCTLNHRLRSFCERKLQDPSEMRTGLREIALGQQGFREPQVRVLLRLLRVTLQCELQRPTPEVQRLVPVLLPRVRRTEERVGVNEAVVGTTLHTKVLCCRESSDGLVHAVQLQQTLTDPVQHLCLHGRVPELQ